MKALVCCTTLVALVTFAPGPVQAQARSRMDLQFGGWWHDPRPGAAMGATGWVNTTSGIAVRGVVGGAWDGDDVRGFEIMYRHRGFVADFEIDVGIGATLLTGEGWIRRDGLVQEVVKWTRLPAVDVLVGRRFGERVGVKAGVGCRFFLGGGGEDLPVWSVVKFMVVVPLGRLTERR